MAVPPERLRLVVLQRQLGRLNHRNHVVLAALLAVEEERRLRERRQRRWWVRPWIQRRAFYGQYETLMAELRMEHPEDFRNFMRMEPAMFQELLQRVSPRLAKEESHRAALDPGFKLAVTLRFLATEESYRFLAFSFRVPHNTISLFVPEVCDAIYEEYSAEVFNTPTNPDTWKPIAQRFQDRWNYPHCCGAIDGKHVEIKKPPESGSLYHNYKGFFSVVLLAVVDAEYKFIWADIGANGASSDSGIFNRSPFEPALREDRLGFPPPDPLPNDDLEVPYFLVGDDAFALRPYMMKPYSHQFLSREQRVFNYRTSRARRVSENAFGILANRFRCLLTTLATSLLNTVSIVRCCLTLHNLMRTRYPNLQNGDLDKEDDDHMLVPGAWRDAAVMREVEAAGRGARQTLAGKRQRAYLMKYFNSEAGSVPWQDTAIDM